MLLLSDFWNGFAFLPLERKVLFFVFIYFGIVFAMSGLEIFLNDYRRGKRSKHLITSSVLLTLCASIGLGLVFLFIRDLPSKGAAVRRDIEKNIADSDPAKYGDVAIWAEMKTRPVWFAFDSGGPSFPEWLNLIVAAMLLTAFIFMLYRQIRSMRGRLRALGQAPISEQIDDETRLRKINELFGIPPRKED